MFLLFSSANNLIFKLSKNSEKPYFSQKIQLHSVLKSLKHGFQPEPFRKQVMFIRFELKYSFQENESRSVIRRKNRFD